MKILSPLIFLEGEGATILLSKSQKKFLGGANGRKLNKSPGAPRGGEGNKTNFHEQTCNVRIFPNVILGGVHRKINS